MKIQSLDLKTGIVLADDGIYVPENTGAQQNEPSNTRKDDWMFDLADRISCGRRIIIDRVGTRWVKNMTSAQRQRLAHVIRLGASAPESPIPVCKPETKS